MNSSLPISQNRQDKISIDSILECNKNSVCLEIQRSAKENEKMEKSFEINGADGSGGETNFELLIELPFP